VLAAAALVFFFPAVSLPVMEVEQFGVSHRVGLIDGGVSLLRQNDIALGVIVLVCSVFLPIAKIFGLLLVCAPGWGLRRRLRTRVLRFVEVTGRFSALDVLLVAILVAAFKVGEMVTVHIGPGLGAFTAVVGLSLLASWAYNPEEIWRTPHAGSTQQ
jgi:paraquat-inducible protein A